MVYLVTITTNVRTAHYCLPKSLLLTETFCFFNSEVKFLHHLLVAFVWRQVQSVEAGVRTRQPRVFAHLYTQASLYAIVNDSKQDSNKLYYSNERNYYCILYVIIV